MSGIFEPDRATCRGHAKRGKTPTSGFRSLSHASPLPSLRPSVRADCAPIASDARRRRARSDEGSIDSSRGKAFQVDPYGCGHGARLEFSRIRASLQNLDRNIASWRTRSWSIDNFITLLPAGSRGL